MNFSNVSCQEARQLVEAGAQLVDVRTPMEFYQGALPGALNLPLQTFRNAPEELDPDKPVLLYCVSGNRSAQAMNYLKAVGFKNVYNIGSYLNYLNC